MPAVVNAVADTLKALGVIVVAAVVLLLAVAILLDSAEDTIVLEPLQTPEALRTAGYTGEAVAVLLRDRMQALADTIQRDRAARGVGPKEPLPDITVPGTSASFASLVNYARRLLGWTGTRISGVLLAPAGEGRDVRLVLEVVHRGERTRTEASGTLEEVLEKGALAALKAADPYSAALHLIGKDPRAAPDFVAAFITRARGEAARHRFALGTGGGELPWAYLAHAYWLDKHGTLAEAADAFRRANAAYRSEHRSFWDWAIAVDGEAYARKRIGTEAEIGRARALLESYVWWDGGYASAQLHLGEIYRDLGRICRAKTRFAMAVRIDPNFVNARVSQAELSIWQLTRLVHRDGPTARCLPRTKEQVIALAKAQLEEAREAKPDFALVWFQWGILHELLDEPAEARAKFVRALALNEGDAYAWYKLAMTDLKLARRGEFHRGKTAARALCRSMALGSDLERAREFAREGGCPLLRMPSSACELAEAVPECRHDWYAAD